MRSFFTAGYASPISVRAAPPLDEAGANGREGRQLCGKQRSGGAATDDEDVDDLGKICRSVLGTGPFRQDVRSPGL